MSLRDNSAVRHACRSLRSRSMSARTPATQWLLKIISPSLYNPWDCIDSEREGFEPSVRLPAQRFSRASLSTAQAPLQSDVKTDYAEILAEKQLFNIDLYGLLKKLDALHRDIVAKSRALNTTLLADIAVEQFILQQNEECRHLLGRNKHNQLSRYS